MIAAVAKDPRLTYKQVTKSRFPEGEKAIASDSYEWNAYKKFLKSKGIKI